MIYKTITGAAPFYRFCCHPNLYWRQDFNSSAIIKGFPHELQLQADCSAIFMQSYLSRSKSDVLLVGWVYTVGAQLLNTASRKIMQVALIMNSFSFYFLLAQIIKRMFGIVNTIRGNFSLTVSVLSVYDEGVQTFRASLGLRNDAERGVLVFRAVKPECPANREAQAALKGRNNTRVFYLPGKVQTFRRCFMAQNIRLQVLTGGQHPTPGQIKTITRRKKPTPYNLGQKLTWVLKGCDKKTFDCLKEIVESAYERAWQLRVRQGGWNV